MTDIKRKNKLNKESRKVTSRSHTHRDKKDSKDDLSKKEISYLK